MDYSKFKYVFLDRDGVINEERSNDYVKNPLEFVFETGALEAIKILTSKFESLFIVTNQRGIGRGVMSISDLFAIHEMMLDQIRRNGGDIKNIYYCTDIESNSENRKPNIGMGLQAQKDFPEINFNESIMIGNSKSDIQFGKNLGMYSILVGNKYPTDDEIYEFADANYMNLYQFALYLQNN